MGNSFHATRHPCWTGWAYLCECGNKAYKIEGHRAHLKEHPECVEKNATLGDIKAIAAPLTEEQEKALRIFFDWKQKNTFGTMTAKEFARRMWPDSPGWLKVSNTGNGACRGKGMWLRAGVFLGKLTASGWLYHEPSLSTWVWSISYKGIKALGEKP